MKYLITKLAYLNRNILIIIGIGITVVLWFSIGKLFISSSNNQPQAVQEAPALKRVEVLPVHSQEREVILETVAYTEASKATQVSAEIEGVIVKEFVQKGQSVQKGTPLLQISSEDREEQYIRAQAALDYHQHHYKASLRLADKGFRPAVALADAKAQLRKAEADLIKARQDLDHTKILAPYTGVVEDILVEIGTFVSRGTVVASVVQLDPLIAVSHLPQYDYERVKVGQKVTLELAKGEKLEGTITYLAPVADSKTRTFKMEASFLNAQNKIPGGLSAKLLIPSGKVLAHQIPSHVLSLSEQGETGVKIVDSSQVVHFVPIQILESTPQDFWVGGLPEKAIVIVSGQDFIKPGEKIIPIPLSQPSIAKT
jgi:multidrug efflux system membrane fusion protein